MGPLISSLNRVPQVAPMDWPLFCCRHQWLFSRHRPSNSLLLQGGHLPDPGPRPCRRPRQRQKLAHPDFPGKQITQPFPDWDRIET